LIRARSGKTVGIGVGKDVVLRTILEVVKIEVERRRECAFEHLRSSLPSVSTA
jgi:hypothetical protein